MKWKLKLDLDEDTYKTLLEEGKKLLHSSVLPHLNKFSNEFIHNKRDAKGTVVSWRREEDFNEICIALAIYNKGIVNAVSLDYLMNVEVK
jgi:hypothetical protein